MCVGCSEHLYDTLQIAYSFIISAPYFPFANMFLLLSVSVGDFQQPFEINVELKGVMQDASVMQINKVHQKSRMLHCAAVSAIQQPSHLSLSQYAFIVINHLSRFHI